MNASDTPKPTAADWLARDAQRLPWAELHRLHAEQRGTYAAGFRPGSYADAIGAILGCLAAFREADAALRGALYPARVDAVRQWSGAKEALFAALDAHDRLPESAPYVVAGQNQNQGQAAAPDPAAPELRRALLRTSRLVSRVAVALTRYGWHDFECPGYGSRMEGHEHAPCTCGFRDVQAVVAGLHPIARLTAASTVPAAVLRARAGAPGAATQKRHRLTP